MFMIRKEELILCKPDQKKSEILFGYLTWGGITNYNFQSVNVAVFTK